MWFRRERDPLEGALGHRFHDPGLLTLALAHRSGANEQGLPENNERLEFLGDAVLGLIAAEWLFRRYPDRPEGDLARRKAQLVSEGPLAEHARALELGERVRLGVGEERSGGRDKASILADTLEAVFGALWLDGGMEAARPAVERYLEAADRGGAAGRS
ncbi:MAG TPA: ribonuclease III domain-containing protein, partial [Thermoanaerobaculia bacterium]|nr:ribonuclease III domain-containing protein [Thermoanaerobaculia bacterium]